MAALLVIRSETWVGAIGLSAKLGRDIPWTQRLLKKLESKGFVERGILAYTITDSGREVLDAEPA